MQIDLDEEGYRKVILRSLIKVADQAETLGNRLVRETYNISRSEVDKGIHVTPASISNLRVNINVRGRHLPRIMFAPNQKVGRKGGVILRIKKGGRSLAKNAFITQMGGGHIGVFKRKGKSRLPIGETFTISVAEMFGSNRIIQAIENRIIERFPGILINQLQFYLSSTFRLYDN
jgi:hypothetical protein